MQLLCDKSICIYADFKHPLRSLSLNSLLSPKGKLFNYCFDQENSVSLRKILKEKESSQITLLEGRPDREGIDGTGAHKAYERLDFIYLSLINEKEELQALLSAQDSLKKYRPFVIIHHSSSKNPSSFSSLQPFLEKLNYKCWNFSDQQLAFTKSCEHNGEVTLFALPVEEISHYQMFLQSVHSMGLNRNKGKKPSLPPSTFDPHAHKIKVLFKGKKKPKVLHVKDLEQYFDISYTRGLHFANKSSCQEVCKRCQKALERQGISQRDLHYGLLYSHEIRNNFNHSGIIQWVDEEVGYGYFTDCDIKKGQYIGEYNGLIISPGKEIPHHLYHSQNWEDPFYFMLYPPDEPDWTQRYFINSKVFGAEMRFLNHSDTPNCTVFPCLENGLFHRIIIAHQDIPKGKQLTYNYGLPYWLFQEEH